MRGVEGISAVHGGEEVNKRPRPADGFAACWPASPAPLAETRPAEVNSVVGSVVGLVARAIRQVWPGFELRRPAHGWCQMGGGKAAGRSGLGGEGWWRCSGCAGERFANSDGLPDA
jgi:hypothetical protein